ncbi:hypothetical protein [Streptomyces sp. NPDC046821]|uniref:hypothetical protein n=1 Tax=Streptomyces sp. NPDC046821 TaxID=3154702 RepID=UPI0033EEDA73
MGDVLSEIRQSVQNPITYALLVSAVCIATEVRTATTWRERLGHVFGPPGWPLAAKATAFTEVRSQP